MTQRTVSRPIPESVDAERGSRPLGASDSRAARMVGASSGIAPAPTPVSAPVPRRRRRPEEEGLAAGLRVESTVPVTDEGLPAVDASPTRASFADRTVEAAAAPEAPLLLAQTSGPSGSVFDAGMPPRAPGPAAGTAAGGGAAAAAAGGGLSMGTVLVAGVALGAAAGGGGGGGSSPLPPADTTAPAAPIIDTVAGDDRVNAQERAAGISVSGTAEAGSTVSVTLGTTTRSASASAGGAWTVDFTPAQVPGDGPVNVRATARDAAGNVSAETVRAIVIDTSPPQLQSVSIQPSPGAILLAYDEPIDASRLPAPGAFVVTVDGEVRPVTGVTAAAAVVTLALGADVAAGAVVSVGYSDATGGDDTLAIQDLAGNDAASIDVSSGLVSDGYLRGASVFRDEDGDFVPAVGEQVAVSNRSGQFFVASGAPAGDWLARQGVSDDTGVVNGMALSAPAIATVINPLTTLAQALRQRPGGPADAGEAAQLLVAGLGLLPGARGLYGTDPVAEGGAAQRMALQIAALDATVGGSLVDALAGLVLQAGTVRAPLSLQDSFVLSSLLSSLPLSQSSAAADAATRIGLAASLPAATAAQARALDSVAPAAPVSVSAPTATSDTTPTLTIGLDTTSLEGRAVVAGDRISVLTGDGTSGRMLVVDRAITAGEIAAGQALVELPVLAEGPHSLRVRLTDASGLESGLSTPITLRVDTRAPLAPVVLPVAGDDFIGSAEASGAVISGGAEPDATVDVSFAGVQRTTTASGSGSWSYALTAADLSLMGQGSETVSVTARDAAGNVSAATERSLTIDTIAPSATPTISRVVEGIGSPLLPGQTSSSNTLMLEGTTSVALDPGERVRIFEGGTALGDATVFAGAWTFTTASLPLRLNDFTARVVDAAGNVGAASATFRIDVAALVPFARASIGTPSGVTNVAQPTISGSVDIPLGPGETVRLYDGAVRLDGLATFSDASTWSYELPALGDGTRQLRAVVEDAVGNQSILSATVSLTIDTAPPATPVIDVIAFDDRVTIAERAAGIRVRGTAEPGSEVTIDLGALSTQIVTASNGEWFADFIPQDIPDNATTTLALSVTARDAAGNFSAEATRTLLVNTQAPLATLSALGGGDNTLSTADLGGGADFTVTAAGASDVLLQIVTAGGASVFRPMTFAGGITWQYALTEADLGAIGQGTVTVRARAIDAFGNVGEVSERTVVFDTRGPDLAPFTLAASSDSGVQGDGRSTDSRPEVSFVAEVGSTVSFDPGSGVFGAGALATGAVQTAQGAPGDVLAEGTHTLRVRAVDAAGNVTERVALYVRDLTGPSMLYAQREGATVQLVASETLAPGAVDASLLSVEVGGGAPTAPAGAQASGRTVEVSLAGAPEAADPVSIAYLTGAGGIDDASGNATGTFRVLAGTGGSDVLAGTAGGELIVGGRGGDLLIGGGGDDTFSFALADSAGFEQGSGAPGSVQWAVGAIDRVLDADAGDRLLLDALSERPGGLSAPVPGQTLLADGGVLVVRGDFDGVGGLFTQSSSGADTLVVWDSAAAVGVVSLAGVLLEGVTSVSAGGSPGLLLVG